MSEADVLAHQLSIRLQILEALQAKEGREALSEHEEAVMEDATTDVTVLCAKIAATKIQQQPQLPE